MRRVVVGAMVSMDGVMQAPGGPEEDPTGGFKFGGWVAPFADVDPVFGAEIGRLFDERFDLLLGRRTYDIFAAHWPYAGADDPIGGLFDRVTKYVATRNPDMKLSWQNSRTLGADVVAARTTDVEPPGGDAAARSRLDEHFGHQAVAFAGQRSLQRQSIALLDHHPRDALRHHGVEELHGLIKDGLYGTGQMAEIVGNLKDFSRLDRSKVTSFNLNEGLDSTLLLAKHLLKGVKIDKRFGAIPAIVCSPSQINQVFLNLITNAIQATESVEGAVITLMTREADGGVLVQQPPVQVPLAEHGAEQPLLILEVRADLRRPRGHEGPGRLAAAIRAASGREPKVARDGQAQHVLARERLQCRVTRDGRVHEASGAAHAASNQAKFR